MVRVESTTQNVDSILCKDAGLSEPETFEKCGDDECPRWVAGEWTLCLQSRCIVRNKAVQDRSVQCVFPNNTESDSCDPNERPITRQECYNERCKPYWRMDKWSEVNCLGILKIIFFSHLSIIVVKCCDLLSTL